MLMLGSPSTFELEPYSVGAKSLVTAQQRSNRFGLLYRRGLEPTCPESDRMLPAYSCVLSLMLLSQTVSGLLPKLS